jgi:hypothetical protein
MTFLSRDSRVGVLKSRQLGLPRLWSPITLRADFRSRCSLKQSCSSCWELSNGMPHVVCKQVNRVDSRLFLVGSQISNLTPGPSFGHNLCFRCPNEQCKPILNIYVLRVFNDIKNATSHWVLTPKITLWSFGSPPGFHFPKWELLGSVRVHSLTLSYTPGRMWCDSRASSWPAPLQPLSLGREPKARVATFVVGFGWFRHIFSNVVFIFDLCIDVGLFIIVCWG